MQKIVFLFQCVWRLVWSLLSNVTIIYSLNLSTCFSCCKVAVGFIIITEVVGHPLSTVLKYQLHYIFPVLLL